MGTIQIIRGPSAPRRLLVFAAAVWGTAVVVVNGASSKQGHNIYRYSRGSVTQTLSARGDDMEDLLVRIRPTRRLFPQQKKHNKHQKGGRHRRKSFSSEDRIFWEKFIGQQMSIPTSTPSSMRPTDRRQPTKSPSFSPTTMKPTREPTSKPTTNEPTRRPTLRPTTPTPTIRPTTPRPSTSKPTKRPTEVPPTAIPTNSKPVITPTPSSRPPTRRPATDAPTDRPTTAPTTIQPSTIQPSTAMPVTDSPTTLAPTTLAPTTSAPTTLAPPTLPPSTQSPTAVDPTAAEPTTLEPTTAQPTTIKPTTEEPTTIKPTTEEPTTIQPTTEEPPTAEPTESPTTLEPTQAPTSSPTPIPATCTVNLTSSCSNCEGNTNLVNPVCGGTPTELFMLFTGGGCAQTLTPQEVPCFDFFGGPPTEAGIESFIVVSFENNMYHSAWVPVGSQYVIRDSTTPGAELGAPQSIVIYRSEDLRPANVLQSLLFDGACSQPLNLKDRFGASQVIGFTVDGDTTLAFFNATIELETSVPSDSPGVIMQRLFSEGNLEFYELTSEVEGTVLNPGQSLNSDFRATLDLTQPEDVTFLSTVTGNTNNQGGDQCSAVSFLSIPVGLASATQVQKSYATKSSFSNNEEKEDAASSLTTIAPAAEEVPPSSAPQESNVVSKKHWRNPYAATSLVSEDSYGGDKLRRRRLF